MFKSTPTAVSQFQPNALFAAHDEDGAAAGFLPSAMFGDANWKADREALLSQIGAASPLGAQLSDRARVEREAEEIAAERIEAARAEARAEGVAAGRAEADAELAAAKAMIETLRGAFARQLSIDPAVLAPRIEPLVMRIAETIVGSCLALDPSTIRARVEQGTAKFAQSAGKVELHLNPADCRWFEGDDAENLVIVADPAIASGDFRLIRGDTQYVDEIAGRVERVEDSLG